MKKLIFSLDNLLDEGWLKYYRFNSLRLDLISLRKSLNEYSVYLINKNWEVSENHTSLKPISHVKHERGWTKKTIEIYKSKIPTNRDKKLVNRYHDLMMELKDKDYYVGVMVRPFAGDTPARRKIYYNNIQLPFTIELYEKIPGSSKEKVVVAWKIPDKLQSRNDKLSQSIIDEINYNLPVYHTRAMIKDAILRWKWMKNINLTEIHTLYKAFSKDESKPHSDIVNMILVQCYDGSSAEDLIKCIECD